MALLVQCVSVSVPARPPQLTIPHFGIMQKGWDGLGKIPDPGDLLAKFQDPMALALAPVRRFLEIVEAFLAVKNCIFAIPDSIMRLSPSPIFDCLEGLVEVLAKLLGWIPPLSYIWLALDIFDYCILLIDEILLFFTRLDNKLTEYTEAMSLATLIGDLELIAIVDCGISEVRPSMVTALDMLKFIQMISDVLVEVFLRLIPTEEMQKAARDYAAAGAHISAAREAMATGQSVLPEYPGMVVEAITQNPLVPVPPLGALLGVMNISRNAMVLLYNILAPMVGSSERRTSRELPTYNNF